MGDACCLKQCHFSRRNKKGVAIAVGKKDGVAIAVGKKDGVALAASVK